MITYRSMLELLKTLTDEELDQTATVYLKESDEYVAITASEFNEDNNVLDDGHLFFIVDF